ncbi:MAG TPA: inverse autotransporter beta domain-containing protein, partial [Candidatus Babeliaceae bacterium]|nr:inverse autotransporter beta domain-containing protein [Candidatus Babeliaceae bacterium]
HEWGSLEVEEDPPPKPPPPEIDLGNRYPIPKRIALRQVEGAGQGVSYGTDYSTLEILFGPAYRPNHLLTMLDLRGHRFNNNTYGANAGIVTRYIKDGFCRLIGVNAYFDWRQGHHVRNNFYQLGIGLEALGKRWDFRVNGYIPLGLKRFQRTCVFDDYIGDFVAKKERKEWVFYGYNAEIGYTIGNDQKFFLYAAAGPYYLFGRFDHTAAGGKVRLRPQYKDYVAVDLSASYDAFFKDVYQIQVIFSVPLYQITRLGTKKGPCGISDRQIYQPVERLEAMPLHRKTCWKTNF